MEQRIESGEWGDQSPSTKDTIWGDVRFWVIVAVLVAGAFITLDSIF